MTMIRRFIYTAFYFFVANSVVAQQFYIDSLRKEINLSKNDTASLILFGKIADVYSEINPDSSYSYAEKMLAISKKLQLKLEESIALNQMSYALLNKGNQPRSLQTVLSSIEITEDAASEKNLFSQHYAPVDEFTNRTLSPRLQRISRLSRTYHTAGILYQNAANYEKAINYYRSSLTLAAQVNDFRSLSVVYATLGRTYLSLRQPDSALHFLQQAYDNASKVNYNRFVGSILLNIGRVYLLEGNKEQAKKYFMRGLIESNKHYYYRGVVASNLALADIYKNSGPIDSILYYVQNGLPVAYYLNAPDLLLRSYTALADFYKIKDNSDSTV